MPKNAKVYALPCGCYRSVVRSTAVTREADEGEPPMSAADRRWFVTDMQTGEVHEEPLGQPMTPAEFTRGRLTLTAVPPRAAELVAAVLYAEHRHCAPESCCQANSGPDLVEADKVLNALRDAGYLR